MSKNQIFKLNFLFCEVIVIFTDNNKMSEIEPSLVRKSALWKVSGTNKIGHIEQSRISPSFRLPEKFSPSKGGLNDSRLFNSSIEKVRLSKINSPKDNVLTPKKATVSSQMFSSH